MFIQKGLPKGGLFCLMTCRATFKGVQYITKAAANTLLITGREKVTITSPVYLLRFVSQTTGVDTAFIVSDVSTHPARYQEFTFTEGASAAKTLQVGTHYWYLYAQSSAVNTDYTLADELIDSGVARVSTTHTADEQHEVNVTIKQHHIG
jgi:hypothetical protein